MDTPKLVRSKSLPSFGQLRIHEIQEKITQQIPVQRKPRQKSLRIIVLKKNYRKRIIEEIKEKSKQNSTNFVDAIEKLDARPEELPKKLEIASENLKEALKKSQMPVPLGKLNGGRSLINPTKFTTIEKKITSITLEDSKKPTSSTLRYTKSFSGTSKPYLEVRKPKLVSLDVKVPAKSSTSSGFSLSKPSFFRKPVIVTNDIPSTPVKQKLDPETKPRPAFGFIGRSLFSNGNKSSQILAKKSESSSNFYLSSEALMSHTEKINEMNEKMKYVRQLEKDYNENKIKRQRIEAEENEVNSRRRLSFGKNPLNFLVQRGSNKDC